LPRRRSRYHINRAGSATRPIMIPNMAQGPMERWQDSPPEDEPARMSDIIKAMRNTSPIDNAGSLETGSSTQLCDVSRKVRLPRSATSSISATSVSSRQSSNSTRSAMSSTINDPTSSQTRRSNTRVRKTRHSDRKKVITSTEKDRIFCCTFCCDRFKSKYDWVRHEKSLHLSLDGWVCAPAGGSVLSTVTRRNHCAYCNALDPTPAHLAEHNYQPCAERSRSFRRKDHLVQHLRLAHKLETMPLIGDWKIVTDVVTSRCGFCDQRLADWKERTEHLAKHFRKGSTMEDWQGDHDFPPSIAAKVTHSLPPYLLAAQACTLVPFSATSSNTKDHEAQISTRIGWRIEDASRENEKTSGVTPKQTKSLGSPFNNFAEALSLHLSRYARSQLSQGLMPTDEMFQQEARMVLYDCEDSWNQSIADNPIWLANFRQQH
ncbi:hypothetical protein K431DRAFT_197664, partial [Polychaeton citri CBS 116435]